MTARRRTIGHSGGLSSVGNYTRLRAWTYDCQSLIEHYAFASVSNFGIRDRDLELQLLVLGFGEKISALGITYQNSGSEYRISGFRIRIDFGISIIDCFKESSPKSQKTIGMKIPKKSWKWTSKFQNLISFEFFGLWDLAQKKSNWIWDTGKIPIESFYSPIFLPWVICGGVLTLDSLLEKSE